MSQILPPLVPSSLSSVVCEKEKVKALSALGLMTAHAQQLLEILHCAQEQESLLEERQKLCVVLEKAVLRACHHLSSLVHCPMLEEVVDDLHENALRMRLNAESLDKERELLKHIEKECNARGLSP
jgi:hypothetical protein